MAEAKMSIQSRNVGIPASQRCRVNHKPGAIPIGYIGAILLIDKRRLLWALEGRRLA
jgi:hypothetical protein